jgi:hypothetical protein
MSERTVWLLVGCMALNACDRSLWVETPAPEVTTVCLIDVSGSMRPALREAAREVCVREIESAPPGLVIVRLINDESAVNEAEIARVRISSDQGCDNPFSPNCFEEARSRRAELARLRSDAIARVRSIRWHIHGSTDLVGALAASGDALAQGPGEPGQTRRLVIVSDLEDTARRSADLTGRLTGVDVISHVQTVPSPALSRRRSDDFARLCAEAGATSVRVLPLTPNGP